MPRGNAGGGGDGNGNGDEGDGNDDNNDNDFVPDLQERDVKSESDSDSDDESEDDDKDPEKGEDLGQRELRECDRRLMEVYGDTLHSSNGSGLHGGVECDAWYCKAYDTLVSHPNPMYSPPQGKIGKRFIKLQAKEFKKVRAQEFNSERALILAVAVLRKEPGISRAREIKKRINQRLDLWEAGKTAELVNNVENTAKRSGGTARGEEDDNAVARRYHSMVIDGRLPQA